MKFGGYKIKITKKNFAVSHISLSISRCRCSLRRSVRFENPSFLLSSLSLSHGDRWQLHRQERRFQKAESQVGEQGMSLPQITRGLYFLEIWRILVLFFIRFWLVMFRSDSDLVFFNEIFILVWFWLWFEALFSFFRCVLIAMRRTRLGHLSRTGSSCASIVRPPIAASEFTSALLGDFELHYLFLIIFCLLCALII